MNDRLYIIPYFDKHDKLIKTHLARACPSQFGRTEPDIEKLCLPNIPIWLHNCDCPAKCNGDDCGVEADTRFAEYWDSFFNEVTCQTCLRIARYGHKRKLPNNAWEVLV